MKSGIKRKEHIDYIPLVLGSKLEAIFDYVGRSLEESEIQFGTEVLLFG